MARPLRLEFEDAYYHVMNRALERRRIFEFDRDHEYFQSLLLDVADRWKVKFFAYCLMGSHYHLFVQTPMGNISRVMRHVDGLYAQYFNRTRRRDGPLFRGRFKAIVVEADSYLLSLVRYIHLNPVKAGLAEDPAAYPWSSHLLYMTPDKKAAWLERETVMSNFSNAENFDDFVCQGNDKSLEAFYKRKRFSPFMGSEAFIGSMLKKPAQNSEVGRAEATPYFPDLDSLAERVGQYYEASRMSIVSGRFGKLNAPRNMAIYLAGRKAGFSYADIKRQFNLGTDSAVTRACQRVVIRLQKDARLARDLEILLGRSNLCQVKT